MPWGFASKRELLLKTSTPTVKRFLLLPIRHKTGVILLVPYFFSKKFSGVSYVFTSHRKRPINGCSRYRNDEHRQAWQSRDYIECPSPRTEVKPIDSDAKTIKKGAL